MIGRDIQRYFSCLTDEARSYLKMTRHDAENMYFDLGQS